MRLIASKPFVEYQEARIRQLTAEIERLGARLEPGEARYDVRTANADQLPGLLGEGFDLVTTLDGGRFVVRRRL